MYGGNLLSIDSLGRHVNEEELRHDIQLWGNLYWKKLQLNFSLNVTPTRISARTESQRDGVLQDTAYWGANYTPSLKLTYRFKKQSLQLDYRGTSMMPPSSLLLSVVDYSNPLFVNENNPHLKQSFNNAVRLSYMYDMKQKVSLSWENSHNAISTFVSYDDLTGVRRSRPENINGNWRTHADLDLTLLSGDFSIDFNSGYGYEQDMAYLMVGNRSQKSKTLGQQFTATAIVKHSLGTWENFLVSSVVYDYRDNRLSQRTTETTDYTFRYITSYTFPFNLSLHSRYDLIVRRGYATASMNTEENVWNLGISYRFLKEKRGRLRLEFYDVLHQRTGIHREVSSTGWSEQRFERISSYCLLSFSYNLANFFGF